MAGSLEVVTYFTAHAVALCMIPFGLPGTWLQVGATVVLVWLTDRMESWWIAVFVALALVGELVEFLSGQWGARRFGGSRRAGLGALVGGLVGMFVGMPILPVVGGVVASFIGTFVGAVVGEMSARGMAAPELRVGIGAVLGRAIGVATKLGIAVVILALAIARLATGVVS